MTDEIVIIGAGAAGMMAAVQAARLGKSVTLLERNDRPGRKIIITGKGRCNVTNATNLLNELISAVPVNGRFLYSAFSAFMPQDTMEFFECEGVPLKIERGNRVFPVSDSSKDIVDALYNAAVDEGVKFRKGRAVDLKIEDGKVTAVITEDGVFGSVSECGIDWAKVVSIVETASAVSVYSERTGVTGVVSGDTALRTDGYCIMTYIASNADIKVGDRIFTSGNGGIYPAGLLIGEVY